MRRQTAYRLALLLFAALVLLKFSPLNGFTSLIRFGQTWNEHRHSALQALPLAVVPASNGYDGQFYAQIALDPTLRDAQLFQVIDAPAYRSRRILVPALAGLLGLGNPWWTIQAFALLNVLAWLLFAWLLYRHIGGSDWIAYARWFGCMFSMGALESVRQSLVDLPALLLLLLAIMTDSRARVASSTLWLTLGNLAKETSLLSAVALKFDLTNPKLHWRRIFLSLGACALPLAAWSLYVHHRFPATGNGSGVGNVTWPLLGLLDHLKSCLAPCKQAILTDATAWACSPSWALSSKSSGYGALPSHGRLGGVSGWFTPCFLWSSVPGSGPATGRLAESFCP